MLKKQNSKLIFILVFIILTNHLYAQGPAKNNQITIHMENKSLRYVLQNMSDQTNFRFVYEDELIKEQKITCKLENVRVMIETTRKFGKYPISIY